MSRTIHERKVRRVPAIELRRLVDAATKCALHDAALSVGKAANAEKDNEARDEMAKALGVVRERLGLRPLADLREPR